MSLQIHQNEKRDFIRMQIEAKATLTLNGKTFDVVCRDLSSTGARFQCSERVDIDEGTTAQLEIASGGGSTAPLEAAIEVVRVSDEPEGTSVGVRFVNLN